jgi:integral membrane protein
MLSHPIGLLRFAGLLEGSSFLILVFIAMPLKHLAGQPLAVRIVGMAHGVLFIGFIIALIRAHLHAGWNWKRTAGLLVAALLPFGPFVVDGGLKREQQG